MELPCKKYKCIAYPTCLNKMSITCTLLWHYHDYLNEKTNIDVAWEDINKIFVNLAEINAGNDFQDILPDSI